MPQKTVSVVVTLGIFFLGLLSSRAAYAQSQCNSSVTPTRVKYNALALNMTEAQVAIIMGGTGAELSQMRSGRVIQKSVEYATPTVNYPAQGSISLTFSNGRLTTKSVSGLCPLTYGQCTSAVVPTRAKYDALSIDMTEAQVITKMAGAGLEWMDSVFGNDTTKTVKYIAPSVPYMHVSLTLTFTNGLLTTKLPYQLCWSWFDSIANQELILFILKSLILIKKSWKGQKSFEVALHHKAPRHVHFPPYQRGRGIAQWTTWSIKGCRTRTEKISQKPSNSVS